MRSAERAALLATLRDVGPDAPTLCAPWTAADIAAHLVVSERLRGWPLVAFDVVRRGLPASVVRRTVVSARAPGDRLIRWERRRGWSALLARLESGPPRAFLRGGIVPLRVVEEWIHHEDVRRGSGMAPRPQTDAEHEALWQAGLAIVRYPEFVLGRQGLELALPDGRSHVIGGSARARVEGPAGELLLFVAGRGDAAQVTVTGDAGALSLSV